MRTFMRALVLTVAGFVVLEAGGALAAQADALRNLREVKVSVADFGPYGEACGLDKAAMERAFFVPLAERGLTKVVSGTAYRILIRATNVTYVENSCVSYVDVQLLLNTRYFDPLIGAERPGRVQLWYGGGLFLSDRSEHAATLNSAFRGLGRNLGRDWDLAN
ncbi:MAG: hypothetical protein V3S45_02585 [Kiloniellales bacterium]